MSKIQPCLQESFRNADRPCNPHLKSFYRFSLFMWAPTSHLRLGQTGQELHLATRKWISTTLGFSWRLKCSIAFPRSPCVLFPPSHTQVPPCPLLQLETPVHPANVSSSALFYRKVFPDQQGPAPALCWNLSCPRLSFMALIHNDCEVDVCSHLWGVSVSHLLIKSHEEGGECVLLHSLHLRPEFHLLVESKYLFSLTFFHWNVICVSGPGVVTVSGFCAASCSSSILCSYLLQLF